MTRLCLYLCLGVLFALVHILQTATFYDDLKSYIQKSLVDSMTLVDRTTERILFCHPPPPWHLHLKSTKLSHLLSNVTDILFWDPL